MHLGVHLSDASYQELFRSFLGLVLDPLIVLSGQLAEALERLHVALLLVRVGIQLQTVSPVRLVEVEQHLLLAFILTVVDGDRVVHLVKAVDLGDGRRTLKMTDIGRSLARLNLSHHDLLWDGAESINHDLAFDRLDGIDDDSYSAGVELLLRLLCLHISAGEPGAKARMRMVPAYDVLVSTHLLHHIHELLLEDRINGLD